MSRANFKILPVTYQARSAHEKPLTRRPGASINWVDQRRLSMWMQPTFVGAELGAEPPSTYVLLTRERGLIQPAHAQPPLGIQQTPTCPCCH
ncbi:hypothetical protein SEA_FLATHEAD_42 [Mycobacterium phage Flathead]|nr:hypothetical protein SEA_FLATHEAD_42 [Mycobacterium phage Flathead]